METLETVKVVRSDLPEGFMIINKADLTDEHQLFEPDAKADGKKSRAKADPEPAPAPAADAQ